MKLMNSVAAFAAGLAVAADMVPLMYKPMPGGWHGVRPGACRGVYSRYRNRAVYFKPPHQGARECARRRKQMGTGEFAPKSVRL